MLPLALLALRTFLLWRRLPWHRPSPRRGLDRITSRSVFSRAISTWTDQESVALLSHTLSRMFENLRWNILTRNRNYEGPRVRKQGAEEFFGRGIYDTLV